jgi:cytochrome c oxidase assembly protein subunit 15
MAGKRSIFEEVGQGSSAPRVMAGGAIDAGRRGARGAIRLWLVLIFLMVAAMILVGGMTRLTDSGLSITEWNPVMGALPPMSEADWQSEFAKYQQSPQYRILNNGMSLEAFQAIYWWEWGHRELGRVIGLVWAVGFFGFLLTRTIPPGWTGRLIFIGALGGVQGAIGWWMVASGLTGSMISVASYRLATHLGIAFVILGFTAWYILLLGREETDLMTARRRREGALAPLAGGMVGLLLLQIVLGALVAGIDAGRYYPTWPDMNGHFFPEDALLVDGVASWRAFFENAGLVQFIHRVTGYLLFLVGTFAWWRSRRSPYATTRGAFAAVAGMQVVQVGLGIWTALSAATLHVAITHQLGAILLWVLILRARHLTLFPVQGSIREGTA